MNQSINSSLSTFSNHTVTATFSAFWNQTINSTVFTAYISTATSHHSHGGHHDPVWFFWLQIVLLSLMMLLVITGNSMVIYCLLTMEEMKSVTGMFLMNLAITDLGVGFLSLPFSLAASVEHFLLHKQWFCNVNGLFLVIFAVASLLTLTAISIQKYASVCHSSRAEFSKMHALYAILSIWAAATIFAIGPIFGWSQYTFSKGGHQCAPYSQSLAGRIYSILLLLTGLLIPLITMFFCYFKLYWKTKIHIRRLRDTKVVSIGHVRTRRHDLSILESKLIRTLIIMMIAFIVCWTPCIVLLVLKYFQVHTPHVFETTVLVCAYGNSAVNPVLYALRHRDFQRGFRKIIKYLCYGEQIENEINDGIEMRPTST